MDFTRADLKAAIPARCFMPDTARSFAYLVFDLALIAAAYCILFVLAQRGLSAWYFTAPLIFLIGTLCWSVFVLGHEAGHGAFSPSRRLNTVVGIFTHGMLLVPYRSWQRSHANHHINTGHLDKEEVFRPAREGQDRLVRKIIFRSGTFLLYGWPMYLLGFRNLETYSPIRGSHFLTLSDLYAKHVRVSYLASLATVAGFAALYAGLGFRFGWAFLATYILAPYLIYSAWLTFVTYMQHVSPEVPIRDSETWTSLSGALATVDRNYGPFNWLTHRIGDQHVIHHIFPTIPHYRAEEAMRAIAPILGSQRLVSRRFVLFDFLRTLRDCHFATRAGANYRWASVYVWSPARTRASAPVAAK